jgi:inositol transport system ATP-binding protein
VFGVKPPDSGYIEIHGQRVTIKSPQDAILQGMALLTEDRKETGCFLPLSVQENIQPAVLHERYVKNGFVEQKSLDHDSAEICQKLRVKTPSLFEIIENLSGGNQQKVLIGRWLLTEPKILIMDEPTRGIDVGAKAEIHRLVTQLARKGVAVIMVSSEMPEVLGMSDRIVVMHEGHITGILDRAEADQVKIMDLASN